MKRKIKIGITFTLVLFLMFTGSVFSAATVTVPEKVRIGLFYEGTAVGNFDISAESGLQVGYMKDNSFISLYEQQTGDELLVRKDSYFINNGKTLSEYNPAVSTSTAGEKIGPFHIQLGEGYVDFAAASRQAEQLKQSGIAAYPVFTDSWKLWTGFYTDQASAQANIGNYEAIVGAGICSVIQPDSCRIVVSSKDGSPILIYSNAAGKLQLHPKPGTNTTVFKLKGSRYRGDLEVRRTEGSDMTLINIIPFEQYLYGVVPEEIEASSPAEALKAQAVAARTYALVDMGKHGSLGFDLCPYQHCQVYGGFDAENSSSNKAVDDTRGKLVRYNGKPAETVFFASSGGWTEDVENVWGSSIPYLKSVEDKYEPDTSSHYYWTKTVTASEIANKTKTAKSKNVGEVTGLSINKLTKANRILELQVDGTAGSYVYSKETFRTTFGLNSGMYTIKSDADVVVKTAAGGNKTMQLGNKAVMTASGKKAAAVRGNITVMGKEGQKKTVQAVPTSYIFTGKGWGHGIGMSQEGAKGMAKAGFTYEQILKYYYTGTTVE